MKPLNNQVQVKPVEQEGVLKIIDDQYIVAEVIALPSTKDKEYDQVSVGDKILATYIKDYLVDNTKYYFIALQDIVCIL